MNVSKSRPFLKTVFIICLILTQHICPDSGDSQTKKAHKRDTMLLQASESVGTLDRHAEAPPDFARHFLRSKHELNVVCTLDSST